MPSVGLAFHPLAVRHLVMPNTVDLLDSRLRNLLGRLLARTILHVSLPVVAGGKWNNRPVGAVVTISLSIY